MKNWKLLTRLCGVILPWLIIFGLLYSGTTDELWIDAAFLVAGLVCALSLYNVAKVDALWK
jgi:hypothetical protein